MIGEESVERQDEAVLAGRGEEHVLFLVGGLNERLANPGDRLPRRLLVEASDGEVELVVLQVLGERRLATFAPNGMRTQLRGELADELWLNTPRLDGRCVDPIAIVRDADAKLMRRRDALTGLLRVARQPAGRWDEDEERGILIKSSGLRRVPTAVSRLFPAGLEFEQVAGLAAEHLADRLQRREADGAGLAGLEDRQVGERDVDLLGELGQRHPPVVKQVVEFHGDRHVRPSLRGRRA